MKTPLRNLLWAVATIALLAGLFWHLRRTPADTTLFRTDKISRGDLLISIGATGTIEPQDVIDVGAQVAGQIVAFGSDASGAPIDYGSTVRQGMELARIDDTVYKAQAAQAKAQHEAAQANVQRAQADIGLAQAKFRQAEADWQRASTLGPSKALSQAAYDGYKTALDTAKATLGVSQATLTQAKAQANQANAALTVAKRNLDYCTIKSPVNGVIIDRRVNIGQTVVASLNAPSLFLIGVDLRRMQVWVAVNEADIGKIRTGTKATFTVDAFPNETFSGEVRKVRLNAAMTQNVVTYTVEISTDNSNGRLLPYLTANVRFELDRRPAVLMVPNAALRWTPTAEQIDPAFRDRLPNRPGKGKSEAPPATGKDGTIWTLHNGKARPLTVSVKQTDGVMTEIDGEALEEGVEIVTGVEARPDNGPDAASNPFTPKFRPSSRGGQK